MSKIIALVALQAIAGLATPVVPLLARQGPQQCRNQSCGIATVAGSTGATSYNYNYYPTGDTQDGDCCIIRHFPAAKAEIYANRPNLQQYCALTGGDAPVDNNPPGVNAVTVNTGSKEKRDTTATTPCKPNILIFAKGTLEPGDVGITIGNNLQSTLANGLGSRWQVVGVSYDNSLNGIYCLGLPGGVIARSTISQVLSTCPGSQLVLSGYSQGAMVVRNAIARIPSDQVAKIANVVTFGDPFCGAPIGQYSGPINVFCNSDDGVCNGQLDISVSHLSYQASTNAAIALLQGIQK